MRPASQLGLPAVALLLSAPLGAAVALPSGPEIQVSVGSGSSHSGPQVAVFPDGGFMIVWTVGPIAGGKTVIHAREFAADGAPLTGEFRLIPAAAVSQRATAVAVDRDGSFLLAWEEGATVADGQEIAAEAVYVRRISRHGTTPLGRRFLVHAPSPNARYGGHLAIRADGEIAVTWSSLDLGPPGTQCPFFDTVARVFHAGGSPAGPEILVEMGDPGICDNTLNSAPTGVVWNADGTFTVAFGDFALDTGYAAYLRRFTAAGRALRPLVDLEGEHQCEETDPALGQARDGSLIVAWQGFGCEGYAIQAQRFSASLAGISRQGRVSRRIAGMQVSPALAVLADGGYVVVWDDSADRNGYGPPGRDGDGDGIFGRSFAADGTPQSRDFQVNVATAGNQADPAIAATPDGGAVVAWDEPDADGSRSRAVLARRLRPY